MFINKNQSRNSHLLQDPRLVYFRHIEVQSEISDKVNCLCFIGNHYPRIIPQNQAKLLLVDLFSAPVFGNLDCSLVATYFIL